jgi:hypothetical protein
MAVGMKEGFLRTLLRLHALCIVAVGVAAVGATEHPPTPPVELVRRAVANEVGAGKEDSHYMFHDRKETAHGSQTKLMVETREAMAGILVAQDDRPLNAEQRQSELARVRRFITDPEELRSKQKQERENAERITRIVRAMPEAFLYEYDGTEASRSGMGSASDELVRLKFRPNPRYNPPSRVEQVLTGMQGIVLIDPQKQRIAKIDGTLVKDVGFGWGIFGHLDRGGHFLVVQEDIGNNHWEISSMGLSFTGKLLFFKSINIQSKETYSDFRQVPSNLTFAQGVELLEKQEAALAGRGLQTEGQQSK